jgi:hypothetical protein
VYLLVFHTFLLVILIFKGLTVRRLYKLFSVKGLTLYGNQSTLKYDTLCILSMYTVYLSMYTVYCPCISKNSNNWCQSAVNTK